MTKRAKSPYRIVHRPFERVGARWIIVDERDWWTLKPTIFRCRSQRKAKILLRNLKKGTTNATCSATEIPRDEALKDLVRS